MTVIAIAVFSIVVAVGAAVAPPQAEAPQSAPPPATERIVPPPVVRTIPDAELQAGDVIVTGRTRKGDPLVEVNAASFAAVQAVDDAVVGPAARFYRKAPSPLRTGLRNFLANWREPVVATNYLLQLKPGKAAETLGRFAVNTTIGIVGVIDIAKRKPFRLPRRRNSFANTLGYYGVGPGPFFFAPLIGATTLRDLAGNVIDQVLVPIGPIRPLSSGPATIPISVLSALDYRAEFDEELTKLKASADPYAATRKFYLDRRRAEIDKLRGRPIRPTGAVPPAGPPPVAPTMTGAPATGE